MKPVTKESAKPTSDSERRTLIAVGITIMIVFFLLVLLLF